MIYWEQFPGKVAVATTYADESLTASRTAQRRGAGFGPLLHFSVAKGFEPESEAGNRMVVVRLAELRGAGILQIFHRGRLE